MYFPFQIAAEFLALNYFIPKRKRTEIVHKKFTSIILTTQKIIAEERRRTEVERRIPIDRLKKI
jgi:hypothetical protein